MYENIPNNFELFKTIMVHFEPCFTQKNPLNPFINFERVWLKAFCKNANTVV